MCVSDFIRIHQLVLYVQHITTVSLPVLPFPILHTRPNNCSGEINHTVTNMTGGQITTGERVWCCVLYDSPLYTFHSTKIAVPLVTVPISYSIRWVLGPPACPPAPVPYRWAMEVQLPLGCLRAVDQVWVHPVACIITLEWDRPWAHHPQVTTIQGWVLHHLVAQA